MKKRILSALLSVCMLLTLFLTPALAVNNKQAEQAPNEEDAIPMDAPSEESPLAGTHEVPAVPLEAEPQWISGMVLKGYDLFTKAPTELPTTADGKYLVLAKSGVEGDNDVYALYLNPAPCAPNNGVVAGQGVVAAKLAMEDGQVVGYLAGSQTKVTLDQLLITIEATEDGLTFSNGGNYLAFGGSSMVSTTPTVTEVSSRAGVSGAYLLVGGNRKLTLYVASQHNFNANWQTNFWGPQGDMGQGAAGTMGSSYIYFFHTHVDDGKAVTAATADGTAIEVNENGDFVIPTGGTIQVDGEVTFTVPSMVASVTVNADYASSLVMDERGAFGVMGCTITMQDGTTTSQIARSGDAGVTPGSVTFARTGDNKLYFGGKGAIKDISGNNIEVAPWLDTVGDRTLKSVSIGPGITSVGANAFKFTTLTQLTLAEGLERIGESAFESTKVETVEFPASLVEIGPNAFRGASGLRSVTLPTGLTTLGTGAFACCTRLKNVTVAGDDLSEIPAGAFQAISHHNKLNVVFQGDAPATGYSDFDSTMPFLHQDGAIVYTQSAPTAALARSGGKDAYFANVNGGDLSGVTLEGGVLPVLPAKGGEPFAGWRVGDTTAALLGGSAVAGQPAGTVFTATWGTDSGFTVACAVTVDGVGFTVGQGETLGDKMPADPVRDGYRFAGWVDANGEPFTADTVIMGDTVVVSSWTEIPHYTVRFDPNGGTLKGKTSITVLEGESIPLAKLPTVRREGYTFDGWFTPEGTRFVLTAAITADVDLTAKWTEEGNQPAQPTEPSGGGSSGGSSSGGSTRPTTPPSENLNEPDVPLVDAPVTFVDVAKDAWYAKAVASVAAKGLMKGTGADRFSPDTTLSRGMMAQILYNMEGAPAVSGKTAFLDVKAGSWYGDAVVWGVDKGIFNGVSDTAFAGENALSREQMAVMLVRYAKVAGLDTSADAKALEKFTDLENASDWAVDALAWCVEKGLLQGRGGTLLAPEATITRAEAATILQRYADTFPAEAQHA